MSKETDEEKEYRARFSQNWKVGDVMMPSRASQYVLAGIGRKFEMTPEDKHILIVLAGSSLFQPIYDEMAKAIDNGDTSELECLEHLAKVGEEIGMKLAGEEGGENDS